MQLRRTWLHPSGRASICSSVNSSRLRPQNLRTRFRPAWRSDVRKHVRQNWRSRRLGAAVALMIVVAVFSAATARLFVWPHLEPIPRHVDAIIELAGAANDERDSLALLLAREHRADFLVQSTTRDEAGKHTCLPAVPGVTIVCFHANPSSTRGEAQYIAAEAAQRGWTSVILVTTPDQAWRARLRTVRC